MASILWLRMGERSAKTNVEFHPHVIPQVRCRKVCMDMPCGRTMLAISTSHHPYLGAPVESVLTWEMYHGPPGMTILHVKYYEYVITQLGTGTDHFQHFRHGNFRVLNFESTQLQFRALFFGGDGIILYF